MFECGTNSADHETSTPLDPEQIVRRGIITRCCTSCDRFVDCLGVLGWCVRPALVPQWTRALSFAIGGIRSLSMDNHKSVPCIKFWRKPRRDSHQLIDNELIIYVCKNTATGPWALPLCLGGNMVERPADRTEAMLADQSSNRTASRRALRNDWSSVNRASKASSTAWVCAGRATRALAASISVVVRSLATSGASRS